MLGSALGYERNLLHVSQKERTNEWGHSVEIGKKELDGSVLSNPHLRTSVTRGEETGRGGGLTKVEPPPSDSVPVQAGGIKEVVIHQKT